MVHSIRFIIRFCCLSELQAGKIELQLCRNMWPEAIQNAGIFKQAFNSQQMTHDQIHTCYISSNNNISPAEQCINRTQGKITC